MSDYTSKQESTDTATERECVLAILTDSLGMICCWLITIACCAYAIYKRGALVSDGWIAGVIWATVALSLSILLGVSSGVVRRLWRLIDRHTEYERALEDQLRRYRELLSEISNGCKSQTV